MKGRTIETRIKQAAILICAGLVVQLLTLLKVHPLSFVIFIGLGCPLTAAGILLYLASLVSPEALPAEIEIGIGQTASPAVKTRSAQIGENESSG
jgi:hypothetical protein